MMLIVFMLTLAFFCMGVVGRSMINKSHQEQVAQIKREDKFLDERLEAVLVRHSRLTREAEALEDRLVLLEAGIAELDQPDVGKRPAGKPSADGDPAARWLLSAGKLSLEDYGRVTDMVKKSGEAVSFVEACLALGVITQSVADLATSRSN